MNLRVDTLCGSPRASRADSAGSTSSLTMDDWLASPLSPSGARKAHVLTTTSPPRAEEKSSLYSDPSADSKWDTKDEARYYDADDKEERNTSFVANRFLEKIEEMMDDEGQSVENIFRAWDLNGDGVLTGLELWRASLKMGIELTSDELQEIRDKLDANHDGRISLAEFQAFVEGAAPSQATYREHLRTSTLRREVLEKFRAAVRGVSEAVDHRTGRATLEPRRAFDEIDADGDGRLDRLELRKACNALGVRPPLSPEELDWIFEEYGNDGALRYGDFIDFLEI